MKILLLLVLLYFMNKRLKINTNLRLLNGKFPFFHLYKEEFSLIRNYTILIN